jgi:phosphoglycerol transferase MdoB-like AlkP superfamily enzyme
MVSRANSQLVVAEPVAPTRRRTPLVRCLAVVLLPALLLIWGKMQLLERGGLERVALLFNEDADLKSNPFTVLEHLTFFRADLLVALVIIPLGTLLLARLLGRLRTAVLAVLAIAMVWGLYIEFQTQKQIGRFLSMHLIEDSLRFSRYETGIATAYVDRFDLLKPAVCSLVILAAAWWASGTVRVRQIPSWLQRIRIVAATTGVALAWLVTAVSWVPWLQPNNMQRGVLTHIVRAFQEFDSPHLEAELAKLSTDQLIERYRAFTGSPAPLANPEHFGAAADCDVLMFVMETAPAMIYDTLSDADMPNLARLKRRAWVAENHHSTFPYTSHAMWSLITGWYPSSLIGNYPDYARDRKYPGLMRSLRRAGRATSIYLPDEFSYWNDDSMYALVGVDKRVFTYNVSPLADGVTPSGKEEADVLIRDQAALDEMKTDITTWVRANRRYATVILPQIGHAPWRNMDGHSRTKFERGRSVIRYQDQYLGQLINHLESLGRLEKTIIVVTGDHGIRSRREGAEFRPGMVGDASFRVPMVLYCPPALTQRQEITHYTSHVDVAPSLLDLLGIRCSRRNAEQGSPMWDERLKDRTMFFFAANYLGCDGYRTPDGQCYMWNRVDDITYQSDRLNFEDMNMLRDEASRRSVMEKITVMDAIRKAWIVHAPLRPEGELPPPRSPYQHSRHEGIAGAAKH